MSGKSDGKKRNRAAQSEQHGYQESPDARVDKRGRGTGSGNHEKEADKQRTIEKLKDLERRRRDREGGT